MGLEEWIRGHRTIIIDILVKKFAQKEPSKPRIYKELVVGKIGFKMFAE